MGRKLIWVVIGRVWPAAMGEADLDTPLDS
jgi:hypothetical protein